MLLFLHALQGAALTSEDDMTNEALKIGGWIVADDHTIHATGVTEQAATSNWLDAVGYGSVAEALQAYNNPGDSYDPETDESSGLLVGEPGYGMYIMPATAALVAQVETEGGVISWSFADGLACTLDETNIGRNEMTKIIGQYAGLMDTEDGRNACDEYDAAIAQGKPHDEAEVMASNSLQRAGYNVNAVGGATFLPANAQ